MVIRVLFNIKKIDIQYNDNINKIKEISEILLYCLYWFIYGSVENLVMFSSGPSMHKLMILVHACTIPGVDLVPHEDVLPYQSTENPIIENKLFAKWQTNTAAFIGK